MVRRSILREIYQELRQIRYRLDDIEKILNKTHSVPVLIPESELLKLPDHLRQTYLVVATKGECDATQVSNLTGCCRARESDKLNELVRMGWLSKRKESKAMIFQLVSELKET